MSLLSHAYNKRCFNCTIHLYVCILWLFGAFFLTFACDSLCMHMGWGVCWNGGVLRWWALVQNGPSHDFLYIRYEFSIYHVLDTLHITFEGQWFGLLFFSYKYFVRYFLNIERLISYGCSFAFCYKLFGTKVHFLPN